MSKKKNLSSHKDNVERYKLNVDAVDRLVNAKNKTYPKTKTDPGKQYRSKGFIDKIPSPIKALFIKFWFNGAVCFFIFWGLGMMIPDLLDMAVVLAIVLGMVNDLLVNNTFHFFAITPGSNNKWMMFPNRKLWTFFANIVYSFIVLCAVIYTYAFINNTLLALDPAGQSYLGVEPLLFGILYMAWDMLFVGMKNLTIKIINDAKEKADKND